MVKKHPLNHTSKMGTCEHSSIRTAAIRRTAWATAVTFLMMLIEIVVGELSGSMALLADGWHMATHVFALGLSCVAFYLSRRFASDRRFVFGPSKIEGLASFSSALLLGVVGLWMILESIARLLVPVLVDFSTALIIAIVGLWVNLICVLLLHQKTGIFGFKHSDVHAERSEENSAQHGVTHPMIEDGCSEKNNSAFVENLNLKAAYLHVLSDAVTSLLAILALLVGHLTGISQFDTVVGFVGAALVLIWSRSLLKQSLQWILDLRSAPELEEIIWQRLLRVSKQMQDRATADVTVVDVKLWMLSSGRYGIIVVLSEAQPLQLSCYRQQLQNIPQLEFVAIEVFSKRVDVDGTPHFE